MLAGCNESGTRGPAPLMDVDDLLFGPLRKKGEKRNPRTSEADKSPFLIAPDLAPRVLAKLIPPLPGASI